MGRWVGVPGRRLEIDRPSGLAVPSRAAPGPRLSGDPVGLAELDQRDFDLAALPAAGLGTALLAGREQLAKLGDRGGQDLGVVSPAGGGDQPPTTCPGAGAEGRPAKSGGG